MQQDLSEKQKERSDLKKLVTELKHLEDMKKVLDENIALNEREYKREVIKIEDDFSDKTKELIYVFLREGKSHAEIYQEVKSQISSDIPYDIFEEYLIEKEKPQKQKKGVRSSLDSYYI
jgi:hypothetical protein